MPVPSRSIRTWLGCFAIAALLPSFLLAEEGWQQFRGPGGQGHSPQANVPTKWSESEHVDWKVAIPGKGWSSPVAAKGRIWLTTAVVQKLTDQQRKERLANVPNSGPLDIAGSVSLRAICVDAKSGKVLLDREVLKIEQPEPIHSLNSYASPTPILDGERLYCHFGAYGTVCLNATTGKTLWTNREFHIDHQNGPGASPVLWRDLLIFHCDGRDQQFVVALSTSDGKLRWRTQRSGTMNERDDFRKAYCTPLVIETGDRVQLISPAADWVYSYDPASGKELWKAHYGKLGFSTVPRPVEGHGMVYICTSFLQSRLLAVKHDGAGDVSESHVAWLEDRQVPKMPSLLLDGDLLFLLNDGGILSCLNAKSGELVYRERVDGQYSASPLLAGKHIYLCSREGETLVIETGPVYKEVARNRLDGQLMASPAVVDNSLLLRTDRHLYRIGK